MNILKSDAPQEKNLPNSIFVENLRALMKARGMTQVQLAEAIGTTQASVSRYLQGRIPKSNELLKLSLLFGISPLALVHGSESGDTEAEAIAAVGETVKKLRSVSAYEIGKTLDELSEDLSREDRITFFTRVGEISNRRIRELLDEFQPKKKK